MWTEIAAAAAPSIIKGLFGGESEQKYVVPDFKRLRVKAQKAGFNPLTALGATGGGQLSSPVLSTQSVLAEGLADGIGAGLETWFNREDEANKEEIDRINLETMRADRDIAVATAKAMQSGQPFGHTIPSYQHSSGSGRHGPDADPAGEPGGFMEPAKREDIRDESLFQKVRSGVNGGPSWWTLNPDMWDIGIGELIGGAVVHGVGGAATLAGNGAKLTYDGFVKHRGNPAMVPYFTRGLDLGRGSTRNTDKLGEYIGAF